MLNLDAKTVTRTLPYDQLIEVDGNCVPDECDPDCNDNGITDVCDIADGTSTDSNADNVPDECFSAVTAPSGTAGVTKNRYLSFVPSNGLAVAAIAVDLPDGRQGWVGEPVLLDDRGVDAQMVALVVDAPVFRVWPEDVVYVTGCVVIPDQEYELRAMIAPATFSDPLIVATTPAPTIVGSWADTVGSFDVQTGTWGPPDSITAYKDISALVGEFQQLGRAPVAWVDLSPQWPNYIINFSDISAVLKGFQSIPYFESLPGFPSLADCPLGDQP